MNHNKIDELIDTYPRQTLWILSVGFFMVWQSITGIFGIILYWVLIKRMRFPWRGVLAGGITIALFSVVLCGCDIRFFLEGFKLNFKWWQYLGANKISESFSLLFSHQLDYLLGFSLLEAGILSVIDLISNNPHEESMRALHKGIISEDQSEVDSNKIEKALINLKDQDHDGTVLGVSKYTGAASVIPDHYINQVLLVLGTTGSGKTITLRRFYQRAITKGYPLIIVDGKPDDANIEWLMKLANQHQRQFIGFNCGNNLSYDSLAEGGYTELKDKIISLKDEWSSDYYRSIAEDYLQTSFEVLLKTGKEFDLKSVIDCLNLDDLKNKVRLLDDKDLKKRVNNLENYDLQDIRGLQAHLNILVNSELGKFFKKNDTTFNLSRAIQQNSVVYFALPALRFPSFSKVLGKLIINDIKAVVDRNKDNKKAFIIFDEFSVFAGEQVLNLVNMGRGKGVHAIFGTQGLADLNKVDSSFKDQVLNCVNTIICHRLNDQGSAEDVAKWIGTEDAFVVTAQVNIQQNDAKMGTVKRNKEFIVHPDVIKQELRTGEALYVTKVGNFQQDKVKVKFL